MHMSTDKPIRVNLHQPALPAYRVPIFRELAQRPGIELQVFYGEGLPGPLNVKPDGFKATPINIHWHTTPIGPLCWSTEQIRHANREYCDVLILNANNRYLSLVPALLRAKLQGVRTVLWGHFYSKAESSLRKWLRSKISALGDCLLFYDYRTAERYKREGWPAERVFVAPNAIDQAPIQLARKYWQERPQDLDAFRRKHRLELGPVILFVSRLDPANRLDLLIDAALALKPEFPDLQIIVIGNGESEKNRLQGLADDHGVANQFRFLGAIYDEQQLALWFMAADLFCYPANIGLSILHAFGYGLPVITSDRIESQNPEIVALRDGINGLLYKDGDAESMAKQIRLVLRDQRLKSDFSASALKTATHEFTPARMVDGMVNACRAAARRTPAI